jgi:adenylate kinase family enzyme
MKKRIFVLGTVGSGKSTLAKKLSEILEIKSYDLDDIFWSNKFNKKRNEKLRDKKFLQIINKKSWIIEGVYGDWIESGIKKSDLVIILKIPFIKLGYRITKRTLLREKSKLKGNNVYKDNIKDYFNLLKAAKNYYKKSHKRGYFKHKELIDKHKINFIELKSTKEINKFLLEL